jgi:hypothetical protein
LEIELRVTGVELDLVGSELAGGSADQVNQLPLVGGDRRPAHSLATDERHEDLVGPVDVDVLDVAVTPKGVQGIGDNGRGDVVAGRSASQVAFGGFGVRRATVSGAKRRIGRSLAGANVESPRINADREIPAIILRVQPWRLR